MLRLRLRVWWWRLKHGLFHQDDPGKLLRSYRRVRGNFDRELDAWRAKERV